MRRATLCALALLTGCASAPDWRPLAPELAAQRAPADTAAPRGELTLARALTAAAERSPALRAQMARAQAEAGARRLAAQPPLWHLGWEREVEAGGNVAWSRSLSIGLIDWLLWPLRAQEAERDVAAQRLALAGAIQTELAAVQRAWVQAVGHAQLLALADQMQGSAEVSAELARRMQAAGHFTALDAARNEAYALAAEHNLWQARRAAERSRAALALAVGGGDWTLPAALPPLPASAPDEGVDEALVDARLDVQQAAALKAATPLPALPLDVEWGATRTTGAADSRATELGLALRLPGAARVGAARAEAAEAEWQATRAAARMQLDEARAERAAAWRAADQLLRRQGPLQQRIADEQLRRYNGMLIGVFDLLVTARDSVRVQQDGVAALAAYWQADADWQQARLGALGPTNRRAASSAAAPEPAGH